LLLPIKPRLLEEKKVRVGFIIKKTAFLEVNKKVRNSNGYNQEKWQSKKC
jgi:hypothetical protein